MAGNDSRNWRTGVVTRVQQLGHADGHTLLQLSIGSALSLLELRTTCRMFQDLSVPAIVGKVLDEHRRKNPQIGAAFDYVLKLHRQHDIRSYCIQYNESDRHFIDRLLAEEGITYHFRFDLEGDTPRHLMVLSDLPPSSSADHPPLRYRATSHVDDRCLTTWTACHELTESSVALTSYDYKPASTDCAEESLLMQDGEAAQLAASTLEHRIDQTLYYASNHNDLQRYARLRAQSIEFAASRFHGQGPFHDLTTGDAFVLRGHPAHQHEATEERSFTIVSTSLNACNNLPDRFDRLCSLCRDQGLGSREPPRTAATEASPGTYTSAITAAPCDVPLVPAYPKDLQRPVIPGLLTATVVGPTNEEVFTDELGRCCVRFHWQQRPNTDEPDSNWAATATTWIRVASPGTCEDAGLQFIPRIGQEVVVGFVAGDVDRPVILSTIHNGRYPAAAFSGVSQLPADRTLSGIRSREHHGTGYSELVMDDTTGQLRARLATTAHATELNMGRLVTPRADGSATARGEGAELRTDAAIAIRAAQGLLLTTYARQLAAGEQLDRQELMALLEECAELLRVGPAGGSGLPHTSLDTAALDSLKQSLQRWPAAGTDDGGAPVLALAAAAGIVSATSESQLHYAANNQDLISGGNLQFASGQTTRVHARENIDLHAQTKGIRVTAADGDLTMQADAGSSLFLAKRDLRLHADSGELLITAPSIRLVAADGSYLRIGPGIEVGTAGGLTTHAASFVRNGPKTSSAADPGEPSGTRAAHDDAHQFDLQFLLHDKTNGEPLAGITYRVQLESGRTVVGRTDENGLTELITSSRPEIASIEAPYDDENTPNIDPPDVSGACCC